MLIKKYFPNILSLFRIFCIIPFLFYIYKQRFFIALIVLFLGSISDFLDGYIARKFNVESDLGALLDPLADKLFSNSVLWGLCLMTSVDFSYYCAYLILAISLTIRDLALLTGSSVVIFKKISVTKLKPLFISKLCTALIFTFIIYSVAFIHNNGYSGLAYNIGLLLACLCVLFVIATFLAYMIRFFKNFNAN